MDDDDKQLLDDVDDILTDEAWQVLAERDELTLSDAIAMMSTRRWPRALPGRPV